jgi:multidrug efflux pump subunit AcrB
LIREGKTVREAAYIVGEQRFRPILLTSITDLAGLLPLLLSAGRQAQAVQPMAISLSFGRLASAVWNLLVVPVIYLGINDLRRAVHWLRHGGTYPIREIVEEEARERLLVPG